MKKLIFIILISCSLNVNAEEFLISNSYYINQHIQTLKEKGWVIKDVKAVNTGQYSTEYIIKYDNG